MTQEDKELLLKDLCARLPYEVKVCYENNTYYLNEINPACKDIMISVLIQDENRKWCAESVLIEEIKPYLRPMSSMTEEEVKYKLSTFFKVINTKIEGVGYIPTLNSISAIGYIDWLNAHHFNFRNLIERGLAIDCTDLNIY